jgi:hypothetical protein
MILGHSEAAAFSWATSLSVAAAFILWRRFLSLSTMSSPNLHFHHLLPSPVCQATLPSDSTPFSPVLFEKDKIYNRGEPIIVLWVFHRYHDRNV